jgi:hypothetical protein
MGYFHARILRYPRDRRPGPSTFWRILSSLALALLMSTLAWAAEQADDFIKGLQDRGLHELALEYLEQMKTSPLASEQLRGQIPYHRGVVLIEQSRKSADPAARDRLLDEARKALEKFAEANPHNVQGAEAQLQLATVQMSHGQEVLAQILKLPKESVYDAQRRTLGQQARLLFAEARETYGRAETIYSAELEKLPPATSTDARDDSGSKRQEYRARVAQLRYLAAESQFEAARSYPPEADEFRQLNKTAAEELAIIYEEFARTNSLIGLYARLTEGRCYAALGSYQQALGCFEDILGQPNVVPQFRKLIAGAVQHKAEVLSAQEKYDAAIDACRASLKDVRKDEEKQSEWIGVRFRLAEALTKKSESAAANSTEQRKLNAEAREAYRLVAKSPGEFQVAARTAAAALGSSEKRNAKDEPRTFQAAYDAGKEALTSYNAAKLALPTAEKNNPPALPELKAEMERGKEDARRYFGVANTLVESDTDPKLVNEVRYFLCWLYWEGEDFYRAAVLGEFLARRYPDHPAASSAAKIAMASFERLYNQAAAKGGKKEDSDFEARRMAEMAQFIARRWPGSDDADAAFGVLVSYAIRSGRIDEAEKMLGEASEQSRPRLELQLGNAIWARYLAMSQPDQPNASDQDALAKLQTSAEKYLRGGIEAARKQSQIDESVATAALYLAQALLGEGKYDEALNVLEDRETGPLTLVSGENPAAARPQFEIETYKAALRAYVSVTPPKEKQALETMQLLEKAVRADGGEQAADQLTRIYIGLGVALQKQIGSLKATGRIGEAKRVSAAFLQFLDRIAAQPDGAKWPVRVWLGQTYYNLGTDDETSPAPRKVSTPTTKAPPNEADRRNLSKARDIYKQLLDDAAKDPKLPPSDTAVLAVKMQLGECYRALGQYQSALDTFSDILRAKETSLAVQRAAALAYQDRGQSEDAKFFENAIHGGIKLPSTGQNRIWGWLKISQVAARAAKSDKKYYDAFYEARVNIARCRYLAAMKSEGAERQQGLTKAKQGIQSLAQLYPDLGGERWKPEFDELLKNIQREETDIQKNSKSK